MKIIHVAQFLGIGGLEKIIYHLALGQKEQGHDVSVYIYDELRTWVPFFRESGINVITPKIKKAGYDLTLMQRMNNDLMAADVINTHDLNPLMYLGPLIKLRKMFFLKSPKLVHTAHGLDHIENYPRAMTYQKIVSPLADKIIGVSDKIGHFYREIIKLESKKINVVQNGIAVYKKEISKEVRNQYREWLITRHNLDKSKSIILSLSRIVPLKNQEFLVKLISKRNDLQLLVVGPSGDDQYFEKLKSIASDNIHFVGPQELIHEYNLGSDIYVSASTHEGIPVAVLEAMSVKTPCLVSNIPGHMTLLKHGPSVLTFNENNDQEFMEKIDKILSKSIDLEEMTDLANNLVQDHYSLQSMVKEYLQVYK